MAWQTRTILWHEGLRFSEWTAIAIWVSDIFMLALFVFAMVGGWRPRIKRDDWLLVAFFGIGALSLTQAVLPVVGWYQLIRLAWFILFVWYVRQYAWHRFDTFHSALAFVAGAVGQAALGLAQFFARHDVGIRIAGETLLRTDMQGVAVFFDATGEKILRAYGTLPHPNVLAAYLMAAFWVLLWMMVKHRAHWLSAGALALVVGGMLATFSRTVIVVWALVVGVFLVVVFWPRISRTWPNIREVRRRLLVPLMITGATGLIFCGIFWPQVHARLTVHTDEEAVQLRIAFARNALATGQGWLARVNWLGVGIGNFVPWLAVHDRTLPSVLIQPAHNVYLLVYSETGVISVGIFIFWLSVLARRGWRRWRAQPVLHAGIFALVASLAAIALNDHFLWTLQQGRLLWWGILAIL